MGTLGAWAAWWLTGRLVLRVLGGHVPALVLTGATCQRKSLKAGGKADVGGREDMLPCYSCMVPALFLAKMPCTESVGLGRRVRAKCCWLCCTEHPAPWCQFWTLWGVQGDASRHPCMPTAMAAVLGLLEEQQSKPQAFLASVALAFCLQLISSCF